MGKLYLPSETHGMWDARSKTLTVFAGESAYVGYQGIPSEIPGVQFSATGPQLGECATEVYDEGPSRRSAGLDTSKPGTLQFTCTDGGGKPLAPPISVVIKRRPNYRQAQPVGQIDETACWAACLSWWLSVQPDRPNVSELNLIKLGAGLFNADGTINPGNLERLVVKQGYRMHTQRVKPGQLHDFLGNWPLMLGFTASGGFAHMNVLCGYDSAHDTVDTMEPMYPDPIFNDDFKRDDDEENGLPLFVNKATGDMFKYDGAVRTGLSFSGFQSSPLNGGYFWIGYPAEYAARMV